MNERSREIQLDPDPAINAFIDTFDIEEIDKELLKRGSLNPSVRDEIHRIWHLWEIHGEDKRDEAEFKIKSLAQRLVV
jgi:hypothetical protein